MLRSHNSILVFLLFFYRLADWHKMKLSQIGGGGGLLGLEIRGCSTPNPNLGPLGDDAALNRNSDSSTVAVMLNRWYRLRQWQ